MHQPKTQVQDSRGRGGLGIGAEITRSCMGWPLLVTLSHTCSERSEEAAKGLSCWAARCFAEFTLSGANVLSMTGLSSYRAIAS